MRRTLFLPRDLRTIAHYFSPLRAWYRSWHMVRLMWNRTGTCDHRRPSVVRVDFCAKPLSGLVLANVLRSPPKGPVVNNQRRREHR